MATFSNMQLERFAVNAIETLTLQYPLNSKIPVGDKGISFDGEIEVLENTSEKKDSFVGKVPVQVKGTEVNQFSGRTRKFSVEIADMKNYYSTNGVVFFVVEITKSGETKVFYKQLLPLELKLIINEYGNQKKRVITLRTINETTINDLCRRFLTEAKKQPTNLIENNPFTKEDYTSYQISSLTYDPKTEDNIREHDFTIYGVKNKLHVPIAIGRIGQEIVNTIDTILINNRDIIEASVEIRRSEQVVTITIEESVEIKIQDSLNKFSFNIMKFISIEKQLKVLPILIAFLSGEVVKFKDTGTIFGNGKPDNERILAKIKELHQDFINLKTAFSLMNVDIKTEFKFEPDNFQSNIKLFIDLVVNNDLSKCNNLDGDKIIYNLGGLRFLFVKILKPNLHLINPFTEDFLNKNHMFVITDDNGREINKYPTSPFLQMKKEDLINYINIDFSIMRKSFKKIEPIMENDTFDMVNTFCLNCIGAYDLSKRIEFLNLAEYIYSLHKGGLPTSNEVIIRINQLQINIRKNGKLSNEETSELINIKLKAKDEHILFGTSVLLKSVIEAKIFYEGFSDELKEEYKTYPIFRLYKEFLQ